MKVLLTGSTGFIGRALVNSLRQQNYFLILPCRNPPSFLQDNPLIIHHPIADLTSTDWRPMLENCDIIIHCAARAHQLKDNTQNPLAEFLKINLDATLNLAQHAAQAGVKRFIFLSSIGVLGTQTQSRPFTELQQANPHTPYALSKWEAEQALQALAQNSNMEIVIIRPPLVYDADAPGNFATLLQIVAKGFPLPLKNLSNRRSLLSRNNLIQFIKTCMHHPQAANQTFLVSDDDDLSTTELITLLAEGMNKPARLFSFPSPLLKLGSYFIRRPQLYQQLFGSLQIDISKAKQCLNWKPPIQCRKELIAIGRNYMNNTLNL